MKKYQPALWVFAVLIVASGLFAYSQNPVAAPARSAAPETQAAPPSVADELYQQDLQIKKENQEHSELMTNEEYLTTEIGPRLTYGKEMQAAAVWTAQRFRDYGLDAHNEDITPGIAWYPGVDTAEMTAPWHKELVLHSLAYSPSTCPAGQPIVNSDGTENTKCEITAQVVIYTPGSNQDVKGKIVLQGPPPAFETLDQDAKADNAYDGVITPNLTGPPSAGGRRRGGPGAQGAPGAPNPLAGAAVVLRDGGKHWGLMVAGAVGRGGATAGTPPSAVMSNEDYALLYRMVHDYHNTVTLKIALRSSMSSGPEKASITVAQIKGTEKPDEQVIIGGHLDSWYLGQGATDNGTGAMSVLEAARILNTLVKTQGWKPKRTLTFILFTQEENGGGGARTYIQNHMGEMPKTDAVLVDDTGTGKFLSISMDGFWETGPQMNTIYSALRPAFGLDPLDSRTFGSSDHVAFESCGVPAYFGVQAEGGYGAQHHTNADTFDKVIPDQVNQGAGVIAAWMWNVSQLDEFFPRHPAANCGAERRPPSNAGEAPRRP